MIIVTLGSMTPPVGGAMYTVQPSLDCEIDEYVRDAAPFLAAVVKLAALLIIEPNLMLFVPRTLF